MTQNDDNNNTSNEKKIENMENWRNEHGQPSFKYLQSLIASGSPAGLEKLKSIAEDLDVDYDSNISAEELIEKIISARQSDPDATT